jgi:transposase
MKIIGCDFHPSFQQIAMVDTATGELVERKLLHPEEATKFYEALAGQEVLLGLESMGNTLWLERLLSRLGFTLRVGDALAIRVSNPRKQKTDKRDAEHILRLLQEGRFPQIWIPSLAERDLRQLLKHRHTLVQMRTRVKNQLQHIALNQGWQKKRTLWSKSGQLWLSHLELEPWTRRRRDDLLQMLEEMNRRIAQLNTAAEQAAAQQAEAELLMSHPGVGPILALATVLTLGDVRRFPRGKHVASYLGLIPKEASSGQRRRLGAISKQGNSFMRFLLVQAGMSAARGDAGLGRVYQRLLAQRKHHGVAKVAVARQLAVRLYWMLREKKPYPAVVRMQGSPSHPVAEVMAAPLSGRSASQPKQ